MRLNYLLRGFAVLPSSCHLGACLIVLLNALAKYFGYFVHCLLSAPAGVARSWQESAPALIIYEYLFIYCFALFMRLLLSQSVGLVAAKAGTQDRRDGQRFCFDFN